MSVKIPDATYNLTFGGYHAKISVTDGGGSLEHDLFDDSDEEDAEVDQPAAGLLTAFLLALACEGVNIGESVFERALTTAVENYVNTGEMFPWKKPASD